MSPGDSPPAADTTGQAVYAQTRWSGEFYNSPVELAFHQHVAAVEARAFVVALYTTAPLYLIFSLSDYTELGTSPAFWINFTLRLLGAMFCWGLAAYVQRHPALTTARLYRLSLLFFLVMITDALFIYPFSQREFHEIYPGVLVMIVGAFFFVPSRLRYRLIASGYAVVGIGVESIFWFPPTSRDIPLATIFFMVVLAFGVVASRQHERLRRLSFADAERNRQLSDLLKQEVELRRRLEEEARRQAHTDELTGLPNRRCFFEQARQEIQRSKRYGKSVGLVMFDLDLFKNINDQNGHAVGDAVLRVVAERCRVLLRSNDLPARLGGEEFAVLLPETTLEGALVFAERLRRIMADTPIDVDGMHFPITVTAGVAVLEPDERVTLDAFLGCADQALYRGKAQGRNQVVQA